MSARALAQLAYWLGPWTSDLGVPAAVRALDVSVSKRPGAERPMRARIYRPTKRPAEGSLLLVQGLHFAGPDDPRMDRFARILAASGIYVFAPFLPDFAALRVATTLVDDTTRAFEQLEAATDRPAGRPGIFSISFGSFPALRLAADPVYADRVSGLCCFGGYADFVETVRFCLAGGEGLPHDPLNRPVVYLNLLDFLPGLPPDPSDLVRAWERFVHETWGRAEMKERRRYAPLAERIGRGLPAAQRELFMQGCHAAPGGEEIGLDALAAATETFGFLDPRPHLGTLRCPVYVVHGRDDDVIPYTQAEAIRAALPATVSSEVQLTGLYAHTGSAGLFEQLRNLPALAGELRAMAGILRAIHSVASAP